MSCEHGEAFAPGWDHTSQGQHIDYGVLGGTHFSYVCGCILGFPQRFRYCVLVVGERRMPCFMS